MTGQHSALVTIEVTLEEGVYWPAPIEQVAVAMDKDADDWTKLACLLIEAVAKLPGATVDSVTIQPELI